MILINLFRLLRKGVYLYKYMDEWKNFNKASLPEKEEFYSNLNMEDCKDFEIRKKKVIIMTSMLKMMHLFWLIFLG